MAKLMQNKEKVTAIEIVLKLPPVIVTVTAANTNKNMIVDKQIAAVASASRNKTILPSIANTSKLNNEDILNAIKGAVNAVSQGKLPEHEVIIDRLYKNNFKYIIPFNSHNNCQTLSFFYSDKYTSVTINKTVNPSVVSLQSQSKALRPKEPGGAKSNNPPPSPPSPTRSKRVSTKGATFFIPKAADKDFSHLSIEERAKLMKISTGDLREWYCQKQNDLIVATQNLSTNTKTNRRSSIKKN
jgi:hypothetical protein